MGRLVEEVVATKDESPHTDMRAAKAHRHSELEANLLMPQEAENDNFSEYSLTQQTNSADFDAAIPGFEILARQPEYIVWSFQRLIIEFFVLQSRHSEEHSRFFVQKMKTKWGNCNAGSKSIRLNTELTKKPAKCLEYVIVQDGHLIVRHHDDRFTSLMERHLPNWRLIRQTLNAAPLAHADWA